MGIKHVWILDSCHGDSSPPCVSDGNSAFFRPQSTLGIDVTAEKREARCWVDSIGRQAKSLPERGCCRMKRIYTELFFFG